MENKILNTIETEITVSFSASEIRRILNLHYLGNENCNEVNEDGKIVPIKHRNSEKLNMAQLNVCPNIKVGMIANVFCDGTLGNIRVK